MATIHRWPEFTKFDDPEFRADSEQIEAFRTRDFSSMESEIAKVFTAPENRPRQRSIPLIYRITREIASLYVRPPSRDVTGISAADRKRLVDVYKRSDMNGAMREASRRYIAHNSIIVTLTPVSPREVRPQSWAPYEAKVWFDDPMEEDIRRASRLELRVAIRRDEQEHIWWGLHVYTQAKAYVADLDGKMIAGLYNDEGTNPYGYIPAVAARRETAVRGRWFPPLPDDMREIQIGVNIVLSTVEDVQRKQGFTSMVLTGEAAKVATDQMVTGPNALLAFPGDDLGMSVVTPNPPTDKTLAALETTLRMYGAATYVNLQTLLSTGSGITGDAKAMEVRDQHEHRRELEMDFEALEHDLARLTLDTLALLSGGDTVDTSGLDLAVDYHYVEPKRNALQQMQAAEAMFRLGLDTPIEEYSRTHGVSRDKAKERVMANLAAMIEIVGAAGGSEVADGPVDLPSDGDNNAPRLVGG